MRQYFPHNFIIFLKQVRNEWVNGPGQVEHLSNELSVKLSLQVIILSRIFTLNIYGGWFSITLIFSFGFLLFYCLFLGRCLHMRMKGCECTLEQVCLYSRFLNTLRTEHLAVGHWLYCWRDLKWLMIILSYFRLRASSEEHVDHIKYIYSKSLTAWKTKSPSAKRPFYMTHRSDQIVSKKILTRELKNDMVAYVLNFNTISYHRQSSPPNPFIWATTQ